MWHQLQIRIHLLLGLAANTALCNSDSFPSPQLVIYSITHVTAYEQNDSFISYASQPLFIICYLYISRLTPQLQSIEVTD